MRKRHGFTLVELSYVIAVMGLLAAVTIPTYQQLVRRAQADEARAVLQRLAHAELQHRRDNGRYLACGATGEVPTAPTAFPNDAECWKALGVQVDGQVRYRYQVELDGASFTAIAEGDLDADKTTSRFALHGEGLRLEVVRELE